MPTPQNCRIKTVIKKIKAMGEKEARKFNTTPGNLTAHKIGVITFTPTSLEYIDGN